MKRLFIISALTFLFYSCSNQPQRVKGIPESAFWIGDSDGGSWFLIDSINKQAGTMACKIYNDNSGELIADKVFNLSCYNPDKEIDWNNLNEEFDGYDGEYIILKTRDSMDKYCWFK